MLNLLLLLLYTRWAPQYRDLVSSRHYEVSLQEEVSKSSWRCGHFSCFQTVPPKKIGVGLQTPGSIYIAYTTSCPSVRAGEEGEEFPLVLTDNSVQKISSFHWQQIPSKLSAVPFSASYRRFLQKSRLSNLYATPLHGCDNLADFLQLTKITRLQAVAASKRSLHVKFVLRSHIYSKCLIHLPDRLMFFL